jgi:hypothetical protein
MTGIFYSRDGSRKSIHIVPFSELATGNLKYMRKRI